MPETPSTRRALTSSKWQSPDTHPTIDPRSLSRGSPDHLDGPWSQCCVGSKIGLVSLLLAPLMVEEITSEMQLMLILVASLSVHARRTARPFPCHARISTTPGRCGCHVPGAGWRWNASRRLPHSASRCGLVRRS